MAERFPKSWLRERASVQVRTPHQARALAAELHALYGRRYLILQDRRDGSWHVEEAERWRKWKGEKWWFVSHGAVPARKPSQAQALEQALRRATK